MSNRPTAHYPTLLQSVLLCVLPLIAFAIAAFPISDWLVDDALISFAYARNLADGAGFVSQPGKAPVEGFSNPLWTLLFVPGFWLNSDVPLWGAKILGHLFSFGTFFFGFKIVMRLTRSALFGALAMIFLALNTSFVVWNVSGLENALYAFEIVTLAYICLLTLDRLSWRLAVTAGLFAATAALTRPEGLMFVLLWPSALLLQTIRDKKPSVGFMRSCAAYIATTAFPVIAYKSMALAYFGSLFPNTYYAKNGPGLDTILALLRLDGPMIYNGLDLLAAPFGSAWLSSGLIVIAFGVCIVAKRSVAPFVFLIGANMLALLTFMLLPRDWMGEFWFGTPFLALFYPTLFSLIWVACDSALQSRFFSRQFPALAIIAVLSVSAILLHQIRLERFYTDPTTPYAQFADRYGDRFNQAAQILGGGRASLLVPDLGATLFYSKLDVFDMAGFADATIARSLYDHGKFPQDYIFNDVKPTFILTYTYSAFLTLLDSNPEFRKQYVPLREAVDPIASDIVGRAVYSGDYVRRDAIENRPDALEKVRAILYGSP